MNGQALYHRLDGGTILCDIVQDFGGGMAQVRSVEAANPMEAICPLLDHGSEPQPYHAVRTEAPATP